MKKNPIKIEMIVDKKRDGRENPMNILILGGNGYLGSKVADCLLREGHRITCTKRETSDLSRLKGSQVKWIPASVDAVEVTAGYEHFDWVINMACNYGRSTVLYDNVLEANIEFPLRVLNKAAEYQVKNFLTIGTGLPDRLNMYSFSKSMFDSFGAFYAEKQGINFYDLKLEMFYGADEPSDRFISSVVHNMLTGREVNMTLGTQKRDIIWVEDIVNAVAMVLHANISGYHEISVGTGDAPSVAEIVEYIWEETGFCSKLNKGAVSMREYEPDCVADPSFLSGIGRWNPVDWKTGLHRMIEDVRYELEHNKTEVDRK